MVEEIKTPRYEPRSLLSLPPIDGPAGRFASSPQERFGLDLVAAARGEEARGGPRKRGPSDCEI